MSESRPTDETLITRKIIDGDIIPSKNGGFNDSGNPIGYYTLGSAEFPFRDLYLGPNTLYVNGTPLVQGSGNAMNINVDDDQTLNISTNNGTLNLSSINSNVILKAGSDIKFQTDSLILQPHSEHNDGEGTQPYYYNVLGFREDMQNTTNNYCIPYLLNRTLIVTDEDPDPDVDTTISYTGLERSIKFKYNSSTNTFEVSGGTIKAGSLDVTGNINFGGNLTVGGSPFRSGSFQLDDDNNAVFNEDGNVGVKKTPHSSHSLDVSGRIHADSVHASGYIGTNSQIELNIPFSTTNETTTITVSIDNPYSNITEPQSMMVDYKIMASDVNSNYSLLHTTDYIMGTSKSDMETKSFDIHKRIESNIGITFDESDSGSDNKIVYELIISKDTALCNGFLHLKISSSNSSNSVMTASYTIA
jgi:hypothetical protein